MSLLPGHRVIAQSSQLIHKKASSLSKARAPQFSDRLKTPFSAQRAQCLFKTSTPQNPVSFQSPLPVQIPHVFSENLLTHIGFYLSLPLMAFPASSSAAETAEVASDKINVDAIIISIDDFLNRNPFFVSGVTVIWLVVIPLVQGYFKKFKAISASNAYRKLREVPEAQLLDIRKNESVRFMDSPNLKILNKKAVWVSFEEGKEDEFVKNVLWHFSDPANTILCILDNFDGNSLKVAELLYNNGFKAAYSIRNGVRGKDGWLEIQKSLPPSVAMWPRKSKLGTSAMPQLNGQETNYGDNYSTINQNENSD